MNPYYHSYAWGLAPFWFGLGAVGLILTGILLVILIALKGYSLWYAAKRGEPWWFVFLLILNTLGILELIYLIFIVKAWDTHGHHHSEK